MGSPVEDHSGEGAASPRAKPRNRVRASPLLAQRENDRSAARTTRTVQLHGPVRARPACFRAVQSGAAAPGRVRSQQQANPCSGSQCLCSRGPASGERGL